MEYETDLAKLPGIVFDTRKSGDFEEVTYFTDPGSPTGIAATSAKPKNIESLTPTSQEKKWFETLALKENQKIIETIAEIFILEDESVVLTIVVPIPKTDSSATELQTFHYLQLTKKLGTKSEQLVDTIGMFGARYSRLEFLRGPIQLNFLLTLTLVMLVVLLFAILDCDQIYKSFGATTTSSFRRYSGGGCR